MESKKSNEEKPLNKVDKTLNKTEKVINRFDAIVDKSNDTLSNIGDTANNLGQLANNIKDAGQNFIEIKKIQSETELGIKKIVENHKTINKHIDTEYKKQKQGMDKAGDVVDSGIESGNIQMIRTGLEIMTGIANHNPMTDLKNHLDNKIENFDDEDDDDIIEI